jgi:hypothetical protein
MFLNYENQGFITTEVDTMGSPVYRAKELCPDRQCGSPLHGHGHTARCWSSFIHALLLAFPELATSEGRLTGQNYDDIKAVFARHTEEIVAEMDLVRIPLLKHLRCRAAALYVWAALTVRGVEVRRPPKCIGLPPPTSAARRIVAALPAPPKRRPMHLVPSLPQLAAAST